MLGNQCWGFDSESLSESSASSNSSESRENSLGYFTGDRNLLKTDQSFYNDSFQYRNDGDLWTPYVPVPNTDQFDNVVFKYLDAKGDSRVISFKLNKGDLGVKNNKLQMILGDSGLMCKKEHVRMLQMMYKGTGEGSIGYYKGQGKLMWVDDASGHKHDACLFEGRMGMAGEEKFCRIIRKPPYNVQIVEVLMAPLRDYTLGPYSTELNGKLPRSTIDGVMEATGRVGNGFPPAKQRSWMTHREMQRMEGPRRRLGQNWRDMTFEEVSSAFKANFVKGILMFGGNPHFLRWSFESKMGHLFQKMIGNGVATMGRSAGCMVMGTHCGKLTGDPTTYPKPFEKVVWDRQKRKFKYDAPKLKTEKNDEIEMFPDKGFRACGIVQITYTGKHRGLNYPQINWGTRPHYPVGKNPNGKNQNILDFFGTYDPKKQKGAPFLVFRTRMVGYEVNGDCVPTQGGYMVIKDGKCTPYMMSEKADVCNADVSNFEGFDYESVKDSESPGFDFMDKYNVRAVGDDYKLSLPGGFA